jgi:hypothetical protein
MRWRIGGNLGHVWIGVMALFRVKPTSVDEVLAKEIASRASPVPEEVAGELSWGADEHLLLGCAAADRPDDQPIATSPGKQPLAPDCGGECCLTD